MGKGPHVRLKPIIITIDIVNLLSPSPWFFTFRVFYLIQFVCDWLFLRFDYICFRILVRGLIP